MWVKTENSCPTPPELIERVKDIVIIRRRPRLIAGTADRPEHYEYEEWQMPVELYEIYKNFETLFNEQADALIELAEMIVG